MGARFLELLEDARFSLGQPMIITSGYRCPLHNANVGGVPGSSHTKGVAVDIKCSNNNHRFKLVAALIDAGFTRIGIANTFVHVDLDKTKPQERIWTY